MNTAKKIVSPFEFAITEIADPEAAKAMRPETREEQMNRVEKKFDDTMMRIVAKPGSDLWYWQQAKALEGKT